MRNNRGFAICYSGFEISVFIEVNLLAERTSVVFPIALSGTGCSDRFCLYELMVTSKLFDGSVLVARFVANGTFLVFNAFGIKSRIRINYPLIVVDDLTNSTAAVVTVSVASIRPSVTDRCREFVSTSYTGLRIGAGCCCARLVAERRNYTILDGDFSCSAYICENFFTNRASVILLAARSYAGCSDCFCLCEHMTAGRIIVIRICSTIQIGENQLNNKCIVVGTGVFGNAVAFNRMHQVIGNKNVILNRTVSSVSVFNCAFSCNLGSIKEPKGLRHTVVSGTIGCRIKITGYNNGHNAAAVPNALNLRHYIISFCLSNLFCYLRGMRTVIVKLNVDNSKECFVCITLNNKIVYITRGVFRVGCSVFVGVRIYRTCSIGNPSCITGNWCKITGFVENYVCQSTVFTGMTINIPTSTGVTRKDAVRVAILLHPIGTRFLQTDDVGFSITTDKVRYKTICAIATVDIKAQYSEHLTFGCILNPLCIKRQIVAKGCFLKGVCTIGVPIPTLKVIAVQYGSRDGGKFLTNNAGNGSGELGIAAGVRVSILETDCSIKVFFANSANACVVNVVAKSRNCAFLYGRFKRTLLIRVNLVAVGTNVIFRVARFFTGWIFCFYLCEKIEVTSQHIDRRIFVAFLLANCAYLMLNTGGAMGRRNVNHPLIVVNLITGSTATVVTVDVADMCPCVAESCRKFLAASDTGLRSFTSWSQARLMTESRNFAIRYGSFNSTLFIGVNLAADKASVVFPVARLKASCSFCFCLCRQVSTRI